MKKLAALFITFSIITTLHAQKRTFIRVYDVNDNLSAKGFFAGTTDSSVYMGKDSFLTEVPALKIGYIKTGRTAGHTILISSVTGAVAVAVIGVVSGEPNTNNNTLGGTLHDAVTFTPGEGFIAGFIAGACAGAATGGIIAALNKHATFQINGNLETWKQQKPLIDKLIAGNE